MVEEIPPETVHDRLDDEALQIVDIRPSHAFERGHIPGAINIPMAELPRLVDEQEWGNEIVVACPIGQSSVQAARLIESFEGVDEEARVASMEGGYDAWEFDLEPDDEDAGELRH